MKFYNEDKIKNDMLIATNQNLAEKKRNWIDFNAGEILDGVDVDEKFFGVGIAGNLESRGKSRCHYTGLLIISGCVKSLRRGKPTKSLSKNMRRRSG